MFFQKVFVMYRIFVFLGLLLCVWSPVSAQAGDVVACGAPAPAALPTEEQNYCDIYQRQLTYRQISIDQTVLLKERQERFPALQEQAYQKYLQNIDTLNEKRGAEFEDAAEEAKEKKKEVALTSGAEAVADAGGSGTDHPEEDGVMLDDTALEVLQAIEEDPSASHPAKMPEPKQISSPEKTGETPEFPAPQNAGDLPKVRQTKALLETGEQSETEPPADTAKP